MTPDASGKFKGISVPSIPWSEKGHAMTTTLRHEIRVERPAFEKRHDDPKRDYGIGCVKMSFASVGEHGAVALTVFTGWYLPHVAERLRRETRHETYGHDPKRYRRCSLEGHGGVVEIHADHAPWDGQGPDTGECRFTGGQCWGDTGFTAGETLFDILVERGQDDLFAELDRWYRDCVVEDGASEFGSDRSGTSHEPATP